MKMKKKTTKATKIGGNIINVFELSVQGNISTNIQRAKIASLGFGCSRLCSSLLNG